MVQLKEENTIMGYVYEQSQLLQNKESDFN
jgi:hypothetical protein